MLGINAYSRPVVQASNGGVRVASELQLTSGSTEENSRLTDCYFDKKDWRACRKEVRRLILANRRPIVSRLTEMSR